jgi:hypothetical protein
MAQVKSRIISKPRAARVNPPAEELVDKEINELFAGNPPKPEMPSKDPMEEFIRSTARSKVAVVVPLYGYWGGVENGFFDEDILRTALEHVVSFAHTWYIIPLAEPERLTRQMYETLNGYNSGGNMNGVRMPAGSTYPDYVAKGIEVALRETDSQYIVVYNPWGVIQKHGVDSMIERITLNGNAPVICGYDMRAEIAPQEFMSYKVKAAPREFASYRAKHLLSLNFIGMKRFIAEMCTIDPRFKTQPFAERDFFQQVAMKGFDAVTSERVPTFFFEVPWEKYVEPDWYADDMEMFVKKWGFTPADIKIQ